MERTPQEIIQYHKLSSLGQVCLMRLRFERYLGSFKRSTIEKAFSRHDKLFMLWTLNRQAKIFLFKLYSHNEDKKCKNMSSTLLKSSKQNYVSKSFQSN